MMLIIALMLVAEVLLVLVMIIEARRVTIYEKKRRPEIQAEVEQADIDAVNRALSAKRQVLDTPRVLTFDAAEVLVKYERRLK